MTSESPWQILPLKERHGSPLFKYEENATPVIRHPLFNEALLKSNPSTKAREDSKEPVEQYDFEDPLGATNEEDQNILLDVDQIQDISMKNRAASLDNTLESKKVESLSLDIDLPDFEPWREKRAQIVKKFRPKEHKSSSAESLRKKVFLALENSNFGPLPPDPNSFATKIAEYNEQLLQAWNNNQRIEAMKVALDVARTLISPSATEIFPYHWVLATDVLDLFGKLVYDRLVFKSNEERVRVGQTELPPNFSSDQVPPLAKETARHWFLKVSDIKELVPRFYVESCLIACLRFLDSGTLRINLERLASMCSKLNQDVTAGYARAYICKICISIDPANRLPHWRVLNDWFQINGVKEEIPGTTSLVLSGSRVISPAVEWILQCATYGAHTTARQSRFPDSGSDQSLAGKVSLDVRQRGSRFGSDRSERRRSDFFGLGRRLTAVPPVGDICSVIKKKCWEQLVNVPNVRYFLACSIDWTIYVARCSPAKDVEKIVDIVYKRIEFHAERLRYDSQSMVNIEAFIGAVVNHKKDSELCQLLLTPSLHKILAFLSEDRLIRLRSARAVLTAIVRAFKPGTLNNFQVFHVIIDQGAVLCGSLDLECPEDETRISEKLLIDAISTVNLTYDLKQGLQFLVSARTSLGLRQSILGQILSLLSNFTLNSYRVLSDGAKKADFLRVCITNFSVTIPAIHEVSSRFRLSLQAAQLSLLVNCLPQIDTSIRRCIESLEILSSQSFPQFATSSIQFLAILQFVPDLPERQKILYYFDKFYRILERNFTKWQAEETVNLLVDIYIQCLRYLCVVVQSEDVPHFKAVVTNSVLYGGSEEFLQAVSIRLESVMEKLLPLAAEDRLISLQFLENIVSLLEVDEDKRHYARGLLKRAMGLPKFAKRAVALVNDMRAMAPSNEDIFETLDKLRLIL
ncbi:unnamed protein product [Caenorhabditis auriculariae]|uniref:Uncharacterized protein n=1 Tax=Caenorhabditis auriculariae TaxID=2777116 RepID=A0A8S1H9F0_9PELO|nr:unnamed protein product [Caenorhabditis auriculariae]